MNKDKIRAFADKVYGDMAGAMAMGMAYIGVEKGLFGAMAGKGAMTKVEVTAATRLQPRYVEEWLAGMTSAGYLEYDAKAETFTLPDEYSYLVASEGTDHFMGGLFCVTPVLSIPTRNRSAKRETPPMLRTLPGRRVHRRLNPGLPA
jgi:hypothetical protein